MTVDFRELSEAPRKAIEAMTTRREVEEAYRESIRNLSVEQVLALERDPTPHEGDTFDLWPKALKRKLDSFDNVFHKDGQVFVIPV